MRCPHCQAKRDQVTRFCPRCGAALARDLGHPSIATVYDVNESDGLIDVSMEYLQGTRLRERLRELRRDQQPMDADTALAIAVGSAAISAIYLMRSRFLRR